MDTVIVAFENAKFVRQLRELLERVPTSPTARRSGSLTTSPPPA